MIVSLACALFVFGVVCAVTIVLYLAKRRRKKRMEEEENGSKPVAMISLSVKEPSPKESPMIPDSHFIGSVLQPTASASSTISNGSIGSNGLKSALKGKVSKKM
jgi:hypothetical protein